MNAVHQTGVYVTYASAAVCGTFMVLYHVLSRGSWRRSSMGVHLMVLAGVDAAVFGLLTAARIWPWLGRQLWFQWIYLVIVSGIALVTLWRAVILWLIYHRKEGES